jgi:pyruvate formate lyase activating enzyme
MNVAISRNPGLPARTAQHKLRIGGLSRLTTIDYPGQLAAVVFCQACPWQCRYCHNPELIESGGEISLNWDDCQQWLRQRRGLLDAVVFSGGEPTLQQALGQAMQDVRDQGFLVGLHSAGCYPQRLQSVLPLVDWVGLDIKALVTDYVNITGVPGSGLKAWQSLDLVLQSGIDHEIRVTVHSGLSTLSRLQILIRRLAERGVQNLALQACQTQRMADASCGPSSTQWLEPLRVMAERLIPKVEVRP